MTLVRCLARCCGVCRWERCIPAYMCHLTQPVKISHLFRTSWQIWNKRTVSN